MKKQVSIYLKQDAFSQSGREILNTHNQTHSDPVEIFGNAYPGTNHADLIELETKVFRKIFANDIDFIDGINKVISYETLNVFDGTILSVPMTVTAREVIKFCAQLQSLMMDAEVSIPENSVKIYEELGVLNDLGKSTPLFRRGRLFQLIESGQRQWDGMPPAKALVLFQHLLGHLEFPVCTISRDQWTEKTDCLCRLSREMAFIKDVEEQLISDRSYATDFARSILRSTAPVVLQSGHYKHGFYVEFRPVRTSKKMELSIVIHNFNGTAFQMNSPVAAEENYFFPYVLTISADLHIGPKNKHNSFDREASQLAQYIQLLLLSARRGGVLTAAAPLRSNEPGQPKILKHEQQWLNQLDAPLFIMRDVVLGDLQPHFNVNGTFDLDRLKTALTWATVLPILKKVLPEKFKNNDFKTRVLPVLEKNQQAVFESIQTTLFLGIIYNPKQWLGLDTIRRSNNERQFAPYSLQHIGNCSIHNMKAALYSAVGLDSQRDRDRDIMFSINIALQHAARRMMLTMTPTFIKTVRQTTDAVISSQGDPDYLRLMTQALAVHDATGPSHRFVYCEASKKEPNQSVPYAKRALIEEASGHLETALDLYTKAIDRCRGEFSMLCNRGVVLLQLGKINEAKRDLDLAIQINPKDANAFFNRSQVHFALNKMDLVVADLTTVLELKGPDPLVYFQRGAALIEMHQSAESDFLLAIDHGLSDMDDLQKIRQYAQQEPRKPNLQRRALERIVNLMRLIR